MKLVPLTVWRISVYMNKGCYHHRDKDDWREEFITPQVFFTQEEALEFIQQEKRHFSFLEEDSPVKILYRLVIRQEQTWEVKE